MFIRGFAVNPVMVELICTNGAIDVRKVGSQMGFRHSDMGELDATSVVTAVSAVKEAYLKKSITYEKTLFSLEKKDKLHPDVIDLDLQETDLPKGFRDKHLKIAKSLEEGVQVDPVLPKKVATRKDNYSVLTYTARQFGSVTKAEIEKKLFAYAPRLLELAA